MIKKLMMLCVAAMAAMLAWAAGGTKASTSTKVTADVTYYAQRVYDGSITVSAAVAEGCEAMGKVTGGKTAKVGTKVTLKATANKGYVFSHWESNVAIPMNGVDYFGNPTFSYAVNEREDDPTFVAYFIPVSEDWVDVFAHKIFLGDNLV